MSKFTNQLKNPARDCLQQLNETYQRECLEREFRVSGRCAVLMYCIFFPCVVYKLWRHVRDVEKVAIEQLKDKLIEICIYEAEETNAYYISLQFMHRMSSVMARDDVLEIPTVAAHMTVEAYLDALQNQDVVCMRPYLIAQLNAVVLAYNIELSSEKMVDSRLKKQSRRPF